MRWELAIGLSLALAASASAAPKPNYFPDELRRPVWTCTPDQPQPHVFAVIEELEDRWFGGALQAAREAPLYHPKVEGQAPGPDSWRFLWLRSFHNPVVVRIETAPDGRLRMTAKRLSGKGGYKPGRVAATVGRFLTPTEAEVFRKLAEAPTFVALTPVNCEIGLDGAQWIVESRVGGTYRFVNRWGGGDLYEIGKLLLGFTGWDLDPVY